MSDANYTKSHVYLLGIFTVTLLLLLVGAYFSLFFFTGEQLTAVNGAKFVPQSVLSIGFIPTEEKNWQRLNRFTSSEVDLFLDRYWQNQGINYSKDIEPWLGGAMVALLSTENYETLPDNFLFIFGIKNKWKFWRFFELISPQVIPINLGDSPPNSNLFNFYLNKTIKLTGTVVENKLILSFQEKNIKKSLENWRNKTSYADINEAKIFLESPVNLSNELAKIYLIQAQPLLEKIMTIIPKNLPLVNELLQTLISVDWAIFDVFNDDVGIRLKSSINFSQTANAINLAKIKGEMWNQFPQKTLFLASGSNLKIFWSYLLEKSTTNLDIQAIVEPSKALFELVNLDLERDIFTWLDGEFNLAIIPAYRNIFPRLGVGAALIVETSHRQDAENTLNQLLAIAQSSPFFQLKVSSIEIGDTQVTQLIAQSNRVLLNYGWLDNNHLLFTLGTSFNELLEDVSLEQEKNFFQIKEALPSDKQAYFYWNLEQSKLFLNNRYPEKIYNLSAPVNSVLNSLKSMGMTVKNFDFAKTNLEILLSLRDYSKNSQ